MKLLTYSILTITCALNWFTAAYRPISNLFSGNKKIMKRNGSILSSLWQLTSYIPRSCGISSLNSLSWKSIDSQFSRPVNPLVADYLDKKNRESSIFSLINIKGVLSKLTSLSGDSATTASQDSQNNDSKLQSCVSGSDLNIDTSLISRFKSLQSNKAKDLGADVYSYPSADGELSAAHLVGFMEYDPKIAATSSYRSLANRRQRSSSATLHSWFNM